MANELHFTKIMDITTNATIAKCENKDVFSGSTDVSAITDSTSHIRGSQSVSFAKSGTTEAFGFITSVLGGANGRNLNIFSEGMIKAKFYVSALTNVSSVTIKIGTSASHCNVYTRTNLVAGWNDLQFFADDFTSQTGNGCNWLAVKYVEFRVTFGAAANTLTGILLDYIDLARIKDVNTQNPKKTAYEADQLSIATATTDYDVKTTGGMFSAVSPATYVNIRTDETITIKLNSTSNAEIEIKSTDSPFEIQEKFGVPIYNIFITNVSGSTATIDIEMS